jgi:hypothetical protein
MQIKDRINRLVNLLVNNRVKFDTMMTLMGLSNPKKPTTELVTEILFDLGTINNKSVENDAQIGMLRDRVNNRWNKTVITNLYAKENEIKINVRNELLRQNLYLLHRYITLITNKDKLTTVPLIVKNLEPSMFVDYQIIMDNSTIDSMVGVSQKTSSRESIPFADYFESENRKSSQLTPDASSAYLLDSLITELLRHLERLCGLGKDEPLPTRVKITKDSMQYSQFIESFLTQIVRQWQINDTTSREVDDLTLLYNSLKAKERDSRQPSDKDELSLHKNLRRIISGRKPEDDEPSPEAVGKNEDTGKTNEGALEGEQDEDGLDPELVMNDTGDNVGYDDAP